MHQGWLVGVVAAVLVCGCDGSSTTAGQTDGPAAQADGPAAQADGAPGADPAGQTDGPACDPQAAAGPGGMNPGTACLGCHATMSGSRKFTLAGTMYTDAAGSAKAAGVTVHVSDANGQTLALVSGNDGAFYTTQAITFPVSIRASKCPTVQEMPAQASSGDCNQAGCHASGNRVHVP
ncbi:MAG TPA: hypothetical protein VGQ83_13860 [Polyangia bacterium]